MFLPLFTRVVRLSTVTVGKQKRMLPSNVHPRICPIRATGRSRMSLYQTALKPHEPAGVVRLELQQGANLVGSHGRHLWRVLRFGRERGYGTDDAARRCGRAALGPR